MNNLSIIILCKHSRHLAECIQQIAQQSTQAQEVLLVDISKDRAVAEYLKNYPEIKHKILPSLNKEALFQLIREETGGTHVTIIESYELFKTDYLKDLHNIAVANQADLVLSHHFHYNETDGLFYFQTPYQDQDGPIALEVIQQKLGSSQEQAYLNSFTGKLFERQALLSLEQKSSFLQMTSEIYGQFENIAYCSKANFMSRQFQADLISLIVPIYNVDKYLEECLRSIKNQSYQHLEILLIDDGSTDNSKTICQTFADADKRFRYIYQENQGLSAARNQGMSQMQGQYFCFVDSDDVLTEQFIEKLHRTAQEFSAQVVVGNYFKYLEKEQHFLYHNLPDYYRLELISKQDCIKAQCHQVLASGNNFVTAWGKLYHHSLAENTSYPQGKLAEDEAVTHKFYLHADRVAFHNEDLYLYRVRENSIMTNPDLYLKLIHDSLEAFGEKIKDICLAGLEPTDMVDFYQHYLQVHCHNLEQLNLANTPLYNQIKEQLSLI
ncbi:TPA: glycosyltransferase [Streptococcus suis]